MNIMITLDSIPTPNPQVVGRYLDGEAVLVHPVRGKVKVLNEVGAAIWAALDGVSSAREIAGQVRSRYEVGKDTAEGDTLAFLQSLLDRDLISLREN